MKASLFTPEELEELRLFDAQVDAEPMTEEDYEILDTIDALLDQGVLERKLAIRRESDRRYYESHREKKLEYARQYHRENREKILAQKKAWMERRLAGEETAVQRRTPTLEEIRAKERGASKRYYEKHKEQVAARKARWYQENKARIAAQQKTYRERRKAEQAAQSA